MSNAWLEKVAVRIAMANFGAYVVVTLWLGGNAMNGKVEAGHYFLSNHDNFTEVGRGVFIYSYSHTVVTFIAMLLAFCTLSRARGRPPGSRE